MTTVSPTVHDPKRNLASLDWPPSSRRSDHPPPATGSPSLLIVGEVKGGADSSIEVLKLLCIEIRFACFDT